MISILDKQEFGKKSIILYKKKSRKRNSQLPLVQNTVPFDICNVSESQFSDDQSLATYYWAPQYDNFGSISNSLAVYTYRVVVTYFVNGCIL